LFINNLTIKNLLGQEEFDRLRSLSYNDTHVIIVCYSIDNRDSLENIPNRWIEELQEGCPQAKTILVALKCDLRDDEVALKKIKPVLYEEVSNTILLNTGFLIFSFVDVHHK
jgi:Rho family protein